MRHGKKYNKAQEKVGSSLKLYGLKDALASVKELAFAKFNEAVDVDVNLGIDPTQGEQVVRGSVMLPHGTGKPSRVIVFAKGAHAQEAATAGADEVGAEDLIEKIQGGWLEFDYAVATPDLMGKVGVLAKVLGPKGLLPNKKLGTVTFEVGSIVTDLKKGRLFFKNDKQGIVHASLGKVSFDAEQLMENMRAFFKALAASKPSASKGVFIKKITVSSTMGVGLHVNPDEIR
jgi:large subunit ribosomal protein L1